MGYINILMVDKNWVEKIALLARLKLTEEEVEIFSRQLDDILDFVDQLEDLDTSDTPPYIQNSQGTPMREDEVEDSLPREDALKNAPQREEGFFVVPRIVEV